MLIAAVRTGADAVYFGGSRFNARRNADNFGEEELAKAIKYCRLNNVKSYLTLNTLIKDNEIPDALQLVQSAYSYGIDAVIVQDIGLAELLHKKFPDLPLHASTQMSVHSAAALDILKNMGFCRVVPAREMSKTELIALCKRAKELNIDVEVFVHGALCMCLSGQCYFSAFLGGRSANRGLCAGTCRLPFSAKGGTGYDLSLKDLSLVAYLNELTKIGVSSFKIEGRMKRPEYVASAVTAMRQTVDFGRADAEIIKLLEQVFSREGFTDGYYTSRLGRSMFGIRSEQDKLLTADALSKLHGLYRNELQKIPINMKLVLKSGEPARLTAKADGKEVSVLGNIPQQAIKLPLTKERAKESLLKLGGTCYKAKDITAEIEDGLMLPVSALNQLRQSAVSMLNDIRVKQNRAPVNTDVIKIPNSQNRKIKGFFARFATLEQLSECKNILSSLKGYSLPLHILLKALNTISDNSLKQLLLNAYAEIPRGSTLDEAILKDLDAIKNHKVEWVICSNLSAVELAQKKGFKIMGGFGLNIFNTFSINTAKDLGLSAAVISPELSFGEINSLGDSYGIEIYSMCYGRQPLMLTRNCPVKNGIGCSGKKDFCTITDRKKQSFPVICQGGFSEILNCKITDVSDSVNTLKVDGGYLYFTLETPENTLSVIKNLLSGGSHSGADYTRGLFKSGVL